MWRDYVSGYIKNNRSSGISVMVTAFISALLLSLLGSGFYNLWKYEMERIMIENTSANALTIDIFTVPDLPEAVAFNRELWVLFILIVGMASFSLIVIIHNAFAVSMNMRIHQFGILSSVGATPRQIRVCLLQEAAVLCTVPVLLGNLFGILITRGLIGMTNTLLGSDVPGRHEAVFSMHPLVILGMLFVTGITVWLSAWLPARKLSRITPLEAIRNTGELELKRKKSAGILKLLFGVEGELAENALRAQRRALRTASLSLVLSFMAFTLMQCLLTMSIISTRETYFERYQDVWDIMITVKGTDVDSFGETSQIQELDGVESAVVYQKAMAQRLITVEEMSEEMKSFGGFSHASDSQVSETDSGFWVNAPIIILDDASFLAYCEQIGITPRLDGAVIRNRIRDVTNPDFRHPEYMPYIKGENVTGILKQAGKEQPDQKKVVEEESDSKEMETVIPVLSYTEKEPVLREEYATLDHYELVHFVPVSLWKEMKGRVGGEEKDSYIRILCEERETVEQLKEVQGQIGQLLGQTYAIESENRLQEYETNTRQIKGMMIIFSSFCVLLSLIGIGNVFSNTLGFVRQRKREFARYLSVGMTPQGIKKMFCIEAFIIAGRPVLLTLPLAAVATGYMLRISYLDAGVFWAEAPYRPILAFLLAILSFVALAYYLGWRNVRKISLAEILRDDTLLF